MIDLSNSSCMTTKGRFRHVSLKQKKEHSETWKFYATTDIATSTLSQSLSIFTKKDLARIQLYAWWYI